MSFAGQGLSCVRGERTVFDALDFFIAPGEALVLRGPNGAGKTSLLRLASGLLQPAAGRLLWDGVDIADDPDGHRRRLCFVGHQDAVKSALTVAENLADWTRILDGDPAGLGAALAAFDIGGLADTPAQYLSAGQRRRTALARLATSRARLWLLDEPTVSLDDAGVACLQVVIARHRAGGGMVMAATHIDLGFEAVRELRLGPG